MSIADYSPIEYGSYQNLFDSDTIGEVKKRLFAAADSRLKDELNQADPNGNFSEIARKVYDEFSVRIPDLNLDSHIGISPQTFVENHRDMRFGDNRDMDIKYRVYVYEFDGDWGVFHCKPSNFNLYLVQGLTTESELRVKIEDNKYFEKNLLGVLCSLKHNYEQAHKTWSSHNKHLQKRIEEKIETRVQLTIILVRARLSL